jgi:hypothetical protein
VSTLKQKKKRGKRTNIRHDALPRRRAALNTRGPTTHYPS